VGAALIRRHLPCLRNPEPALRIRCSQSRRQAQQRPHPRALARHPARLRADGPRRRRHFARRAAQERHPAPAGPSYEAGQQKQLEEFAASKAQENAKIQAELDRVPQNQDQVVREQEALRSWQMAKQYESQRISEVIARCTMQPAAVASPQPRCRFGVRTSQTSEPSPRTSNRNRRRCDNQPCPSNAGKGYPWLLVAPQP
jgi:hypothetical protein